jgi:outer membrane protein assembly factor BamB
MPVEAGGTRMYVTMFKSGTAVVRAKDGKKLWTNPLGGNGIAVIPTPIVEGDRVFVTSNYPNGSSGLFRFSGGPDEVTAEKVYDATGVLKNHHGGVVKVGNYLYGHSQAKDVGNAWVCVDFQTGKQKWAEPASPKQSVDKGSISYADGSFYLLGERSGQCVKIAASPDGWKEEGRFTLPQQDKTRPPGGGIWPHPVIAQGKLFLRDQNYLFCFDLKGK